jgi:hypothetical protein
VRLALHVEELLLTSWRAERAALARLLPPPVSLDGDLVSIAVLRFGGGRIGRLPVPPFSQLNVRTYVRYQGEKSVFFLRSFVSLGALAGVVFGAPFRPARIRFRADVVAAPAAGFELPFRLLGSAEPGDLDRLELGLFENRGLRAFRIERGRARWTAGEAAGPIRADVLAALGLDVAGEPALFYTRETSFETDVPPRRLPLHR